MPLYAEDRVFMPPYSESAVGSAAVRKAYDAVFNAITLNVKFTIIGEVAPDWAFARTNSAGTTTDHHNWNEKRRRNQELFIFERDRDRAWKIARYSRSSFGEGDEMNVLSSDDRR
jgi:ketosteroid isomerase-like protein